MDSELRIAPPAAGDIAAVVELPGVVWRHRCPRIVGVAEQKP